MSRADPVLDRRRAIHRVLWLILVANVVVAAAKIAYGIFSGSLAIRADGFHSTLDGLNNVAALIIMRFALQPPDAGHPYGHRKFEVLGSLAIGVMILLLILRLGEEAIASLRGEGLHRLGPEAYVVMVLTLGVNLIVTAYEHREGRRLESTILIADAKHTLADVFVTGAVLIGVLGVRSGFGKADAVATLGVLVVLVWIGYGIFRHGVGVLSDEIVIDEGRLVRASLSVPGVKAANRARSRGPARAVNVDLVVEVDPALSVRAAHEISDRVEEQIRRDFPEVVDVVVHVEPHGGQGKSKK